MWSSLQGIASYLLISFIGCILFTEEPFLSLSGGVLPKVWHRPPKGKLQGQRGRFPRSWKEKVGKHFHNKEVGCHCSGIWNQMHAFKCWPSLAKFDPFLMKICNHITTKLYQHGTLLIAAFSYELPSLPNISQILPEQGSKQLQLGCKDTDNRIQLKHERGGGGRWVFRCLFWSHANLIR